MKYPTVEEVVFLHQKILEKSKGSKGIRDLSLLYSAVEKPKSTFAGKDLYSSIFSKAAVLLQTLILNHAFVDANKRTALAACLYFLNINSVNIKAEKNEFIELVLSIESKQMDVGNISQWLKQHSSNLQNIRG